MIIAEIKLYDEPKPAEPKYIKYEDYADYNTYRAKFTDEEIAKAIAEAQEKVQIGSKFKYKASPGIITIVDFTNKQEGMYQGSYGLNVIVGERDATQYSPKSIQRFGVHEFFTQWMEPVNA